MKQILHYRLLWLILCYTACLIARPAFARQGYTVAQIPDPKQSGTGYISNPDHILDDASVARLNGEIARLEKETGVQMAIVLVNDFDAGQDDFDFALQLFRKWKVGAGKADNGLLLLVAKDRRRYRFITGYGVEGLLSDAVSKEIGEQYLKPAFREQRYADGINAAVDAIIGQLSTEEARTELKQVMEKGAGHRPESMMSYIIAAFVCAVIGGLFLLLGSTGKSRLSLKTAGRKQLIKAIGNAFITLAPVLLVIMFVKSWRHVLNAAALPYWAYVLIGLVIVFYYRRYSGFLRDYYKDELKYSEAMKGFHKHWAVFIPLSPLLLLYAIGWRKKQQYWRKRFAPRYDSEGNLLKKVSWDNEAQYLNDGQRLERKLGTVSYDVWRNGAGTVTEVVPWPGKQAGLYGVCKVCGCHTVDRPFDVVLRHATVAAEGLGKKVRRCRKCGDETDLSQYIIPMVVAASATSYGSSSSSSYSSSGDSSSDSGSSDWGGGDSGGGGAGGDW